MSQFLIELLGKLIEEVPGPSQPLDAVTEDTFGSLFDSRFKRFDLRMNPFLYLCRSFGHVEKGKLLGGLQQTVDLIAVGLTVGFAELAGKKRLGILCIIADLTYLIHDRLQLFPLSFA